MEKLIGEEKNILVCHFVSRKGNEQDNYLAVPVISQIETHDPSGKQIRA